MRATCVTVLGAACAQDPVAPARTPDVHLKLYPAAAYTYQTIFKQQTGEAFDINERHQIVGYVGGQAFMHEIGGATHTLPLPSLGVGASARAITAHGAIGGMAWLRPQRAGTSVEYPAVWPDHYTRPFLLSRSGRILDVNDRVEAVGGFDMNTTKPLPIYWEPGQGTQIVLPLPRGASMGWATGINNDRVIVGITDIGGALWRWNGSSFSVSLLKGIYPEAIDNGYGTVGRSLTFGAPYGAPDLSGTFVAGGTAYGINAVGIASGWIALTADAFVADRFGNLTVLPKPPGGEAIARASTICGIVVGSVEELPFLTVIGREPAYWNPGC